MATKTISIDLEAYEKLMRGRYRLNESFSSVIKRAEFKKVVGSAESFVVSSQKISPCTDEILAKWDKIKDTKPDNPWQE